MHAPVNKLDRQMKNLIERAMEVGKRVTADYPRRRGVPSRANLQFELPASMGAEIFYYRVACPKDLEDTVIVRATFHLNSSWDKVGNACGFERERGTV